jgi:3-hydroxyacyl-CoA dehydrogenase
MGRGIVWLLAQWFFQLNFKQKNTINLVAIDLSEKGLNSMLGYIKVQSLKYAERNSTEIKQFYCEDFPNKSNEEYFKKYSEDLLNFIQTSVLIESAINSDLIFEAVVEKLEIKAEIIRHIESKTTLEPYYFTNTSSIPIGLIEKKAKVKGRIIGFHFYNPPPVQKLLEIIKTDNRSNEMANLAEKIANSLNKTIVYAPDVTGFIGNGQFIREVSYAIGLVESLVLINGFPNAIYMVNEVTKKLLLRPMGIFEVIDYVGINVCQFIMEIMDGDFKNETFNNSILKRLLKQNILGGQDSYGKTKNGIFKYESGEIVGVYNRTKYEGFDQLNFDRLTLLTWKDLKSKKDLEATLSTHFVGLSKSRSLAAKVAVKYGKACNKIGKDLISNRQAFSEKDINTVMVLGFHHLYGPINSFFFDS